MPGIFALKITPSNPFHEVEGAALDAYLHNKGLEWGTLPIYGFKGALNVVFTLPYRGPDFIIGQWAVLSQKHTPYCRIAPNRSGWNNHLGNWDIFNSPSNGTSIALK